MKYKIKIHYDFKRKIDWFQERWWQENMSYRTIYIRKSQSHGQIEDDMLHSTNIIQIPRSYNALIIAPVALSHMPKMWSDERCEGFFIYLWITLFSTSSLRLWKARARNLWGRCNFYYSLNEGSSGLIYNCWLILNLKFW